MYGAYSVKVGKKTGGGSVCGVSVWRGREAGHRLDDPYTISFVSCFFFFFWLSSLIHRCWISSKARKRRCEEKQ